MKQIIKDIYHVGDNECLVYMVDTHSDQGLVLIDAGMNSNASIHPSLVCFQATGKVCILR